MKFYVFPGQGSQYPGMGKDWYENFTEAKQAFEEASDFSGLNLKKLCFDGTDADLKQTEITQPAILTTTVAIYRSLLAQGFAKPQLVAGHSLGEYSALVCAGALSLGEAARVVNHRGRYMQEAVPAGTGGMAALIFKPKTDSAPLAKALCEELSAQSGKLLSVANYNSPEQIVIAGHAELIEKAIVRATQEPYSARKAIALPVSAPFHCALMKPAAQKLSEELKSLKWININGLAYIPNVISDVVSLATVEQQGAKLLEEQITGSVRWVESIQSAIRAGYKEIVEIGPGAVLSGLAKRIGLEDQFLSASNIDRLAEFKDRGGLK